MLKGLKLVYVFDGRLPELKRKEQERRKKLKEVAAEKLELAIQQEDVEGMRKYASRTARLTPEMQDEARTLIRALGLPIVEALSEAEAQASYMVAKGDAYAVATQDSDTLMFGATRVVRNLSLLGKRKRANALAYDHYKPEVVELNETLNTLGIDREQLIVLCMLVGTDYNIGGIKGIGPKNALKHVRSYGKDFEALFTDLNWGEYFEMPWTDVYYLIKNIPVRNDYALDWSGIDAEEIRRLMVDEHEFFEERIMGVVEQLKENVKKNAQTSLFDY